MSPETTTTTTVVNPSTKAPNPVPGTGLEVSGASSEIQLAKDSGLDRASATRMFEKIQRDVDAYRSAEAIKPIDLAVTEQDVDKLVMEKAIRSLDVHVQDPHWYDDVSNTEMTLAFMGFLAAGMGGGAVSASAASVGAGGVIIAGFIGAFIGLLLFAALSFGNSGRPYLSLRNKVILRKKYQREIQGIVARNIQNAESYQQIREAKERKLKRAQKRLKKMNTQYEKNNPGKTLEISIKTGTIVEVETQSLSAHELLAIKATTAA